MQKKTHLSEISNEDAKQKQKLAILS